MWAVRSAITSDQQTAAGQAGLNFLDAGTAVYEALTGGDKINVKIEAGTDVITPFEGYTLPLEISESGRLSLQ